MAFTPITSDRYLAYAYNNPVFRNANRENLWGTPVYFTPYNRSINDYGFGGPHYRSGYNYTNSPETVKGNCTWWCCGRLQDALNKNVVSLMNNQTPSANGWYSAFTGTKYLTGNNAVAGDIIVFSGGEDGHVMFIEKIENGVMYISHSAWSYNTYWDNYACRVNEYNVSDIYAGNSVDMYKGYSGNTYYVQVIGIIHTGDDAPTPSNPILKIIPYLKKGNKKRRFYVKK